jgi:hypothetical protein
MAFLFPVPVNETVVPIGPKPWHKRWERYADRLFGYTVPSMDYFEQRDHEKYMGQMRRGWHLQGQILQNSISAEKVFG